jgi:SAM-dependent methyltransferase
MNYERIGVRYAAGRRADSRIQAALDAALGDARTVLNVGAGAGSYEPANRVVVALEPSSVMRAQRHADAAPVIAASAESLPFDNDAFDACMAILTVHHWEDRAAGLAELRRVARDRVIMLVVEPAMFGTGWLVEEYVPEVGRVDIDSFPTLDELCAGLGGHASIEPLLIPRDCEDGFFEAFWARPEAYLDAAVRQCQSAWHRVGDAVEQRAIEQLRADLESGAWDARHGHLRAEAARDVGMRIITASYEEIA